jgi:FMN phosphatase YigB (HAD superfamily)
MPADAIQKPKALLFDMGGVLLDSVDLWNAEQFPVSFPNGLPEEAPLDWFMAMSKDIIDTFMALPVPRLVMDARPFIEVWLWKRGLRPNPELVERWHYILCHWEPSPIYDFAQPALSRLYAMGFRLGLISNTLMPGVVIRERLQQAGILSLFEFTVFSAEFGANKPAPAIFRHALEAMKLDAGDAWYVGDKPNRDVCGAHSVGMKAVLVDSKHHKHIDDAPENVPDFRIATIADLPAFLERL